MAKRRRRKIPIDVVRLVLHETGYRCGNPICRTILTLEIHHLEYVAEGGDNSATNLLPLCPTCHELHHHGHIPTESLRAWKMMLLALSEAFDRQSIDLLLTLSKMELIHCYGDGVIECAALISSGYADANVWIPPGGGPKFYKIYITPKGRLFVDAWKAGDQQRAIAGEFG